MVFALSTGHQIGLAATGAAFIVFALLSSFVFPRISPDFPGKKGMVWYIPLAVCFFAAMISAVLVFGREKKSAEAAAPPSATTPSTPSGNGKLTSGPYANGDAVAGKKEFASAGCTGCHALKAAGSSGVVGPDLDKLATEAAGAKMPLGQFIAESIDNPDAYIAPGYPKGTMPPFGTTLTKKQIADLVAFVYGAVTSSA